MITQMPGNSRGYVAMAQELAEGWRVACRSAANRLAEVKGAASAEYAADLEGALRAVAPQVVDAIRLQEKRGPFGDLARKLADDLTQSVEQEIIATMDDLSLDLADGRNVDRQKSRLIAIDNRNGTGQFLINSPSSQQIVGRDMSSGSASTVAELTALLLELRDAVADLDVAASFRSELEDAVINAQREAQSSQVDDGRLHRLVTKLGAFGGQVSASAAGGLIAQILALAAGLPQ